jgi:hypothetical protein
MQADCWSDSATWAMRSALVVSEEDTVLLVPVTDARSFLFGSQGLVTMRVLVACILQAGHLTPQLPLASALAAQGDEVVMVSGPEVADTVATAGWRFIPAGSGLAQWFPR